MLDEINLCYEGQLFLPSPGNGLSMISSACIKGHTGRLYHQALPPFLLHLAPNLATTPQKTTTYTLNMLGTWEGYEESNLMNRTFNPLPTPRSHGARPSGQRLLQGFWGVCYRQELDTGLGG